MYKMVIFDLDGTLLNTLDDLANAGNYALSKFGFPIHDVEKYKYFVGNGIPKLIERILPNEHKKTAFVTVYNEFNSYYTHHMNDRTKPYDGVLEMLAELKRNGIISVVVTNKAAEFAEDIVKNYFGDLIAATYGSIEVFPKKPDPYWVNKAVADFDIEKNQIIYVGDSGVDMETAKNADLLSCGVTWGFRTAEELMDNGAKFICYSCRDIMDIILNNK